MRAVGVVGESDAGKTTLIERLIPALGRRGRVATVKSIHHDVEVDGEGTDTHRHRTAGAGKVVGVTPSLTVTFEAEGRDDRGDWAMLRGLLCDLEEEGYDYVLVEGFTATPIPKLVVGDVPGGAAGRVVERVTDAGTVATGEVADGIDRLPEWESA